MASSPFASRLRHHAKYVKYSKYVVSRATRGGSGVQQAQPCCEDVAMPMSLPISPEANELLNRDPLALALGMVLDQQIPLEKAFTSPWVLAERLGHVPTAAELAE